MNTTLFWIGVGVSGVITLWLMYVGIKAAKKEKADTKTATDFFLLPQPLEKKNFFETLAISNAALALIVFWFSYLGWFYGWGALLWLTVCWVLGLELFDCFARKKKGFNFQDFPGAAADNKTVETETLHEYIAPKTETKWGIGARRVLACVSIVSFVLMVTVELSRGMRIIDVAGADATGSRDIIAFAIIAVIAVYSAIGGFRAVLKTDKYQLYITLVALVFTAALAGIGILGKSNLFGTYYAPENFNWKSFLLIPTQWQFIVGSLFSWGFWFFVVMDMWHRTAAQRKMECLPLIKENGKWKKQGFTARAKLYSWFFVLTLASVLIGLYVRVHVEGYSAFPVVDFLKHAFSNSWGNSSWLQWVVFPVIFTGFITAMMSTIDTYMLVITHSIFCDFAKDKTEMWFSRFSVAIIMIGIALVVFPVFLMIYHAPAIQYNINNLLYLTTSIPFVLLPAIFLKKNKDSKRASVSLIVSTAVGFIAVIWSTFYVIYDASLLNWLYLVPFFGALVTLIVYVLVFYPFNNRNK
jgi:Na+/proline symporter